MIMLSLLLTACEQRHASPVEGDAELQAKLVGTWIWEKTDSDGEHSVLVTIAADGSYVAEMTTVKSNATRRDSESGTMLFQGGVLTDTATSHSDTRARLPMVNRKRIVRLDGRELVLQSEERPEVSTTFRRVNPESSATLEKAKKIKLSPVKFDRLPLTVVITMLQEESVKYDAAREGVTISLAPDAKQLADAEINLDLKNVTLAETLERVAESASLELRATDKELLLLPKKAKQ